MLQKVLHFLATVIFLSACTYADYMEECEGITSRFIAVPEDCSFFIYCDGDDSFQDSCSDASPYFSDIFQTCDDNNTVCGNRPYANLNNPATTLPPVTTTVTNISTTPVLSSPFVTTNITFVIPTVSSAIPTNPSSTVSAINTTPSRPISTSSTSAPVIPLNCPAVDDPNKAIFLPNPKSCSDYYLCYHGQPMPMHCSNMLHFDMKQQKCDYPENVNCQVTYGLLFKICRPSTDFFLLYSIDEFCYTPRSMFASYF